MQSMNKTQANQVHGGLTQTSKMPCKSYSLPTLACRAGFKMAQIAGSVCSMCYANKGFYALYSKVIEPAQMARLDSLNDPDWVHAMVVSIGPDKYFRWHDSGDIQDIDHLRRIVSVAIQTPNCRHWLPTREYGLVKEYIRDGGVIPDNLIIRLSAMYPDVPVMVPVSLQGVNGIAISNVHRVIPIGKACIAPSQNGECRDCRACWISEQISYELH